MVYKSIKQKKRAQNALLVMDPALYAYHKGTFPPIPKSRVAVVIPKAWNTLLIVERVIELLPLSNLQI